LIAVECPSDTLCSGITNRKWRGPLLRTAERSDYVLVTCYLQCKGSTTLCVASLHLFTATPQSPIHSWQFPHGEMPAYRQLKLSVANPMAITSVATPYTPITWMLQGQRVRRIR